MEGARQVLDRYVGSGLSCEDESCKSVVQRLFTRQAGTLFCVVFVEHPCRIYS